MAPPFTVMSCGDDGISSDMAFQEKIMKHSAYIEFQCLRGFQGDHPQFAAIWSAATLLRLLGPLAQSALDNPESSLDHNFVRRRSKELLSPESSLSDSPIVIAVPDEIEFAGMSDWPDCGSLRIPASSELNILDGLHHVAALAMANLPVSRLTKETVPVLILPVQKPQRMAALRESLSKRTSKKSCRSLSARGIRKRTICEKVKDLLAHSQFLRIAVAVGKSSLAPRSRHLLTHSGLARACNPMFSALDRLDRTDTMATVAEYWQCLSQIINPWRDYLNGKVSAHEVRQTTILSSTIVVAALGRLGTQVLTAELGSWRGEIERLADFDWRRNSAIWEGRAIKNGVLSKGETAEVLTGNVLKLKCGLTLQTDELALEGKLVHESQ